MAKKTAKKTGRYEAASDKPKDTCFILMPFGGWLDDYYTTIYVPAVEAAGLEPHRADDLFRPSTIVNDIWAYTKRAKLLLADLSGRNPNVFYELGLAHALAKPAILVAASMEEIPFDLRALRIIIYDKNAPDWGQVLGVKITAAISEVLKSPVEAVLPAFLNVKGEPEKPTVSLQQKDLMEIRQDLELLRREVRGGQVPVSMPSMEPRVRPLEAESRVFTYVDMGIPDEVIVKRLAESGLPRGWIKDMIHRAKFRISVTDELGKAVSLSERSRQNKNKT